MPELSLKGVDVYYGQIQALRGLTLSVREGEMVALLGANGAGKTTTLRTISGLLIPASGEIWFDGDRIDGQPAWEVVKQGIAHVPEGRDLFPDLTVRENLRLGSWTQRRTRDRFQEGLDKVMSYFPRLSERADQAAGTMSGGEQQMLVIGRALMSSPKVLIVDELSLGLAPMIVEQLFEILKEVNRAGTSVLLVEQFIHMALAHTDKAYVLAKGEVVLDGASDELLKDPDLTASYLGD